MKSFEAERRKTKLSPEDFIAVQQPYEKKEGVKVNEFFVKFHGKNKIPKDKK